jgi:thiol-disulfide isomerase/thioredoxin
VATTPPNVDVESALDRLVDADAVDEADDGTLTTTTAFEDTRRVYHDTYAHMGEEGFHSTVADLFDIDRDEVAAHVDATGITREELVAYLSIQSFLDDPPDRGTLAVMADIVVQIGPGSPVPSAVREVTDEDYETFLDAEPEAIVTVWKHGCDPCDAMKEEFDAILDAVPDGVAVAGVDGEAAADFRRSFDVSAAPAVLLFHDGDLQRTLTGRKSPAELAEAFESVY